jgi:hypothetical protein
VGTCNLFSSLQSQFRNLKKAAARCKCMEAFRSLLQKAGGCKGEVLCLQQGAFRLLQVNQALPVYAGQRFTIFADYKPLTYALSCVSVPWMARQYRQLAYVAEFTSDINHIAGLENILADTLSQPPGHAVVPQRPGVMACNHSCKSALRVSSS